MLHLTELLIEVTAHALGRGVLVCHLRMLRLQVLQFVHHEVELLVADRRLVQHIVPVVMLVQFFPQLYDSLFLVHNLLFLCKGNEKK